MPTANINVPSQVKTYANLASFPVTGLVKTIYITTDTDTAYYWNGTTYDSISGGGSGVWGAITGTLSNQTDLQTALNNKEPLKGADDNYVTDAQLVVIGNTSGTNTGDETAARIGTIVNGASNYATPLDADKIGIWDAVNSLFKSVTWANIKAVLKTYFDTLYAPATIYNVTSYGLVGDGVTNDSAALSTLLNTTAPTGSTIYFPTGYTFLLNTAISINGKRFNFVGDNSIIKTTANITVITVSTTATDNAAYWNVSGIRFEGSNPNTSQSMFLFQSNSGGFNISGCTFTGWGSFAVKANNTVNSAGTKYIGGRIDNCQFINNIYGCDFSNRAEYMQITSCNFYNTTEAAITTTSGNLIIDGCNISYGKDGVIINSGTNNDHGRIANSTFNHNSNLAFKFTSCANGMEISDCIVYQSNIWLITCVGIIFKGGEYNCTSYFFQGSTGTMFIGCKFPAATYANTVNNSYTGSVSATKYINCFKTDGQHASDPASFSTSYIAAATANTTATVAKNDTIKSITIINTTSNAVTGGIKIGTTAGGTEVVVAQAVGANELVTIADAAILKRLFSTSAATTLYIRAVTSWNSASVKININYEDTIVQS